MERSLHIICFDHPFPPQYGGVIDMYYLIEALSKAGVRLQLHVFGVSRKDDDDPIVSLSEQVFYYPLMSKAKAILTHLPFSMALRQHPKLLENLLLLKAPILFTHFKASALAFHPKLKNYSKFLRLQNIESAYYLGIASKESQWLKKQMYLRDAKRYEVVEERLEIFQRVFSLSHQETQCMQKRSGNACFVPVFHENQMVDLQGTRGQFALFHGDLQISDNLMAAKMLVERFKSIDYPLVIASSHAAKKVNSWIGDAKNIRFELIKEEGVLERLLSEAHLNVLWSFQPTGTKLKLMNCLYKSRFCVVNPNLTDDPNILAYCTVVSTEQEIASAVAQLSEVTFNEDRTALYTYLDNQSKAEKMIQFLFESID
jgi:hypothetical protein